MEVLREFVLFVAMVTLHITLVTSMGDMMHNSISPSVDESMCQQPKTRIIYYTDLRRTGMDIYSKKGVIDYSKIVIDYHNDQLLVGARDVLLQLDLDNLNEIQAADWRPSGLTVDICKSKGESQENCCNYIRVLLIHQDHIFSCGTNAFSPLCTWRKRSNLTNVIGEVTGIARCPYNPQHNTTSLITEQGDLYSATVMDFTARDPVVYRTLGPSPPLRTAQLNSKWLNEPNFVASYEIGPFVYFFFRETAVEYMNCGKVIYSRVARVCKNDIGGEFLLEDNWTTFMKARLNCSLPGEYPFYFNELQATYYDADVQMIYAVYSTPSTAIHGSAVCAYHMSAIEAAFQGAFKFQRNAHSAWVSQPNSNPQFNQCNVLGDTHSRPMQTARELLEAQKYQLMDEAVQPTEMQPLFVDTRPDMRLDQIVVDIVEGKHATYHVMFLGTEGGKILKVIKLPGQKDACILEELCVTPEGECHPLKTMQLHHDKGALYVGLPEAVVKVHVQRCHALLTRTDCINARDPYCGWDGLKQKCTTKPHHDKIQHWHQAITGCPIVQARVDGKFGPWSGWFECRNPVEDSTCLCRQRSCNDPEPKCGGSPCMGETMQVSNCTGKWGEWSGWSRCSSPCNGGIQTRTRKCEPNKMCSGTPEETRECNKQMCSEMRRSTPWTPWMVKNVSEDGFLLQRYRFQCKAPVIDRSLLRVGRMKRDYKFCPYMSTKCWPPASTFGGWTLWSPWLPCSASCGEGQQVRYRTCFPGSDQCVGPPHEIRPCSGFVPCPVHGGWSCWTDWSPCSASCAGGTRQRHRSCTNPVPSPNGHDCFGDVLETESCNAHECSTPALPVVSTVPPTDELINRVIFPDEGWRTWSPWTQCNNRGRKHRSRKCDVSNPKVGQCLGCVKQILRCGEDVPPINGLGGNTDLGDIFQASVPEVQKLQAAPPKCKAEKESMDPAYLLVVGLVSAVAGSIMSVSVYHSWSKSKRHREQMADSEYEDDEDDEFNEEEGESEDGEFDRYSDCEYYEMHNGQVRRDGIPIDTELKDMR